MGNSGYDLQQVFNDICNRTGAIKGHGNNYIGHCPCGRNHSKNDKNRSFNVKLLSDHILLNCFGCGASFAEMCEALGYKPKDLYASTEDESKYIKKKYENNKTIKYAYKGLGKSEPDYIAIRVENNSGKKMWQSAVVDGKETNSLEGANERYPYRLNDWYGKTKYVIVVEGEKCVEALISIGFPATTTVGGAQSTAQWKEYGLAKYFKDLEVYFLTDNDAAGWKYADDSAKYLREEGIECYKIDIAAKYEEENAGVSIGIKGDIADIKEKYGDDRTREFIKSAIIDCKREKVENDELKMQDTSVIEGENTINDCLFLLDWSAMDKVNPYIRVACEKIAEANQSQTHLVLGAWITQISAIFQRYIADITPNRECGSSHIEGFGLYSLYVADSGKNKSGIIKTFGDIFTTVTDEINESLKEKIREDNNKIRVATLKIESLKTSLSRSKKDDSDIFAETEKLSDLEEKLEDLQRNKTEKMMFLLGEDSTVEAARDLVANEKIKTCTVWADEIKKLLSIILGEYKRSGLGADDTLFLKMYNGVDYTFARKGQKKAAGEMPEYMTIRKPQATIFGGIQTELFNGIKQSGNMDYSGFWGRFLFWVDTKIDTMKMRPTDVNNDEFEKWKEFCNDIARVGFDLSEKRYAEWKDKHEPEERMKKQITISKEAFEWVCILFDDVLAEDRQKGGRYYNKMGWFGKLQGHLYRYTACIHCINCVIEGIDPTDREISLDEMKAGWECGIMFQAEVIKILFDSKITDEEAATQKDRERWQALASKTVEWLHSKPQKYKNDGVPFDPNELSILATRKKKEDVKGAINMLKASKIILPVASDSEMCVYNRIGVDASRAKKRKSVE